MRQICFLLVAVALLLGPAVPADDHLRVVRVAVVRDGDWHVLNEILQGFREELAVLAEGEFDVRYPSELHRDGNWSVATIERQLEELVADEEVDLVLALGLVTARIAIGAESWDKPVIAPLALEFGDSLPRDGITSGVPNLAYVAVPGARPDLDLLRELVPFSHVGLVGNGEVLRAMPELEGEVAGDLRGASYRATFVPAGRTAASVFDALPDDVDAVYLWPLGLSTGEEERLLEGLIERRLPSFAALGREEVERGILAGVDADDGLQRLARRTALNAQQILLGTPAEELPVDFMARPRLIYNRVTASRIGVSPPLEVLLEAEAIGPIDLGTAGPLSLSDAVLRAVDSNLDYLVERQSVEAAREEIAVTRSALRPSLGLGLGGSQIDDDRAEAGGGLFPERTVTASASLSQLVYSDAAFGALTGQRELQRSREKTLEQIKLDLALDAAVTYLEVLRAGTRVEVRRTNLEVTRGNLELARTRRSVGSGTLSEVYRWESQIAEDRRNLVNANADWKNARIRLNRLMHVELENEYAAAGVSLADPGYSTILQLVAGYIETELHFDEFRHFTVLEGLARAPELQAVGASIAALERQVATGRRSFWTPTVTFDAGLDETLDRAGAGVVEPLPGGSDDTSWSLSLNATLPLYAGGERKATLTRDRLDLRGLELQREGLREAIEEAIRLTSVSARASFTGIRLADHAATAATRNFELVQDAYARGAIPIIDLVDAQSSALAARLNATDATYDFFIDLMQVQRATNNFDFFVDDEERGAWGARLREHFESKGIEPWGNEP